MWGIRWRRHSTIRRPSCCSSRHPVWCGTIPHVRSPRWTIWCCTSWRPRAVRTRPPWWAYYTWVTEPEPDGCCGLSPLPLSTINHLSFVAAGGTVWIDTLASDLGIPHAPAVSVHCPCHWRRPSFPLHPHLLQCVGSVLHHHLLATCRHLSGLQCGSRWLLYAPPWVHVSPGGHGKWNALVGIERG